MERIKYLSKFQKSLMLSVKICAIMRMLPNLPQKINHQEEARMIWKNSAKLLEDTAHIHCFDSALRLQQVIQLNIQNQMQLQQMVNNVLTLNYAVIVYEATKSKDRLLYLEERRLKLLVAKHAQTAILLVIVKTNKIIERAIHERN